MDVMHLFYTSIGMQRVVTEPDPGTKDVTVVALFGRATEPTHAARRDAEDGTWWQSKLGSSWRIMHRLEELEGGMYGDVVAYFIRAGGIP